MKAVEAGDNGGLGGIGTLLSCTYPGGRRIGCTYDEVNLKKTITDDTGMAAGQSGPMIASYGYIGRRVSGRVYGNDTLMYYAYDGTFNQPGEFGVRQVAGTTHGRIDPAAGTVLEVFDDVVFHSE